MKVLFRNYGITGTPFIRKSSTCSNFQVICVESYVMISYFSQNSFWSIHYDRPGHYHEGSGFQKIAIKLQVH